MSGDIYLMFTSPAMQMWLAPYTEFARLLWKPSEPIEIWSFWEVRAVNIFIKPAAIVEAMMLCKSGTSFLVLLSVYCTDVQMVFGVTRVENKDVKTPPEPSWVRLLIEPDQKSTYLGPLTELDAWAFV